MKLFWKILKPFCVEITKAFSTEKKYWSFLKIKNTEDLWKEKYWTDGAPSPTFGQQQTEANKTSWPAARAAETRSRMDETQRDFFLQDHEEEGDSPEAVL
jgi:hypothetical protein